MTPLEYLSTNPTYAEARLKWLTFSTADKDTMLDKQAEVQGNHRIAPIELTDGRWAVCCDVLTEVQGGVFTPLFALLDMAKLNGAIIIEDAELQSLKPPEEEI